MKINVEVRQADIDKVVEAIAELVRAGVADLARDPEATPLMWDAETALQQALEDLLL